MFFLLFPVDNPVDCEERFEKTLLSVFTVPYASIQ